MSEIKQSQVNVEKTVESETVSAVDESEFSERSFPVHTTIEKECVYDNKEINDDSKNETDGKEREEFEEELGECKKEEGYVLNGYFHSYSTCPVGEDEFN